MDLASTHAEGRSPEAARLAASYTALDWASVDADVYLAAGTRGGDVVVWRANACDAPSWPHVAHHRFDACVLRIACDARRMAVQTARALVLLRLDGDALRVEHDTAWLPALSYLAWHGPTLHFASPGALHSWAPGAPAPTSAAMPSAYVAGVLQDAAALDDGALVAWDGTEAGAPPYSVSPQPLWGAAASRRLVATLAGYVVVC